MHQLAHLELRLAEHLPILFAGHQAAHPPSLIRGCLLSNFKYPLRFRQLLFCHTYRANATFHGQTLLIQRGK
jgi:hypothetical protein